MFCLRFHGCCSNRVVTADYLPNAGRPAQARTAPESTKKAAGIVIANPLAYSCGSVFGVGEFQSSRRTAAHLRSFCGIVTEGSRVV